ncbi:MAG: hypothetical protein E7278_02295 [Lachnospiraceae bacterium]|nr:hypothetical protein [Lachnospiraceae bacterium]
MSFSFDSFVEKTFDNFKRITPALVAVALLTGLLLFLPESILNKMGVEDLPTLWKRVIGLLFLLSTVLMVTVLLFSILAS